MKLIVLTIFTTLLFGCSQPKVKYSALNDLVTGVHQVILYENSEFYLELGAGGTKGTYGISNDTVYLKYTSEQDNWPNYLILTDSSFIATIKPNQIIQIRR